jgi:hypothetical protein
MLGERFGCSPQADEARRAHLCSLPVRTKQKTDLSSSAARFALDQHARDVAALQKQITAKVKAQENADDLVAEAEKLKAGGAAFADAEAAAKVELDKALHKIGNIVHQSVPVSKDEVRNRAMFFHQHYFGFGRIRIVSVSTKANPIPLFTLTEAPPDMMTKLHVSLTANYRVKTVYITPHHSLSSDGPPKVQSATLYFC